MNIWRFDTAYEKTEEVSSPKLLYVFSCDYSFINSSKCKLFFRITQNQITESWISDGNEEGTFLIEDERQFVRHRGMPKINT